MTEISYRQLDHSTIDPNRAKWYALVLALVAALFAVLTIRTNWDYFAQFYDGFAFWARVLPFLAVEAAIVILPLVKGFGGYAQGRIALLAEVLLIGLALTHTYLVSDAAVVKLQAGKTKAEAQADLSATAATTDRIVAANQKLHGIYQQQFRAWQQTAAVARAQKRTAPPAPAAPAIQPVPQIGDTVLRNAVISTEDAGQQRVGHGVLQALLYLMVAIVALSATALVLLADASRVKGRLLKERAESLQDGLSQRLPLAPAQPREAANFTARSNRPELLRRETGR